MADNNKQQTPAAYQTEIRTVQDGPVWSLSWFHLRSKTGLRLWGALAWKFLRAKGVEIVFCGRLIEKLDGRPQYDRDTLVIVRYPSLDAYRRIQESPIYRLLRMIRAVATRRLVYGFSRRLDVDNSGIKKETLTYWGRNIYLLHQFQIDRKRQEAFLRDLPEIAYRYRARLFFCGAVAPEGFELYQNAKGQAFFMDGLIIFEAEDKSKLLQVRNDHRYKAFEHATSRSSFYLFRRLW